ncbi:hypothetical protein [Ligilactobacillus salitolerans]|nr:hypothetical protein [Ligilactobacillus salitolerans]
MNNILNYQHLLNIVLCGILIAIVLFGTLPLFILTAVFIALFLSVKVSVLVQYNLRLKVVLVVAYIFAMIVQIVFYATAVFPANGTDHLYLRIIAALFLPLPFLLEQIVVQNKNSSFYLPSVEDITTFTFAELQKNQERLRHSMASFSRIRTVFSPNNMQEIFGDLNRHSSFRYINDGSLAEDYFHTAAESLDDPYIYIIISNTGSAASELISLFTQKQFNHASLSFDQDLKTIVSYNGGERVYPPGLNQEMLEAFHKKADASVLIYRLAVTRKQKEKMLTTIREINETGSAYNILGLLTKHSLRRNIMFCSQFVYSMLQIAGANYFEKQPGMVQPTDFIELDYHRQLEYVSEIKF